MREQQNPITPELHQPLLFAPSELLACGLRDAHHHPLVGVRTEDGVRSWRTSPCSDLITCPDAMGEGGSRGAGLVFFGPMLDRALMLCD